MKKKYLIISLLSVLLLTGCNSKYSLEIKNKMIKETLTVVENSDDEKIMKKDDFGNSFYDYSKMYGEDKDIETDVESFYSEDECSSNCNYYQKRFINDNGLVGFELSHEFTFEEYASSTIARDMFPAFSSTYDGKYLTISAGPNWNLSEYYSYLENAELLIETDYKVVSTNLKRIKDGKYSLSNLENSKNLYITMDTSIINENEKNNRNYIILLIILVGALFIALIVCAINNRKKYR